MARTKLDKIRAALHAHGVDPAHHEEAIAEAAALPAVSGFSLLALLQLLQTASPAILALVQAILDARKKPPVAT